MVKKLRHKFVIITMLLMTSVFGTVFFADYLYGKYWSEFDTLQTLNLFADCGIFYKEPYDKFSSSLEHEEGNIYFILLDNKGMVIKNSGTSSPNFSNETLSTILSNSSEKWKWRSYIYTTRIYENGQTGIYIADMSEQHFSLKKSLGTICLIGVGFLLLLAVSLYISKFVVEPAKNALEREKQFISDASHELKTPVAAISVNAQAINGLSDDNRHVEYIISECRRMDRLIHKLLTLSFLEDGAKSNSLKTNFSLSKCCEEAALTMESLAFEKNIHFTYEIEHSVAFYGNEDEIKQLLSVLLDNAIKYTPKAGTICFSMIKKRGRIKITVFNTGSGISEKDLPHIFERFYSTEKSRTEKTDSFGLGLSIAKAITESYSGKIFVQSKYNEYARFIVIM